MPIEFLSMIDPFILGIKKVRSKFLLSLLILLLLLLLLLSLSLSLLLLLLLLLLLFVTSHYLK